MFDDASRTVRAHLNNFLRYSWAVALEREAIRYLACCLSVGIYRFETRPVGRKRLELSGGATLKYAAKSSTEPLKSDSPRVPEKVV